jgi:hypothetical protein
MHVHVQTMEITMFLHDWTDLEGMKNDFQITDSELKGVRILLASYTYENYEGDAFVLFVRGRKLYEVNGGHCSCFGLEQQWKPEKTTVRELRHRLKEGTLGQAWGKGNTFADQLSQVLDEYSSK